MSHNEWHVRPSPRDVAIWEVWCDERVVAQSTMDEAWERAKLEARAARGAGVPLLPAPEWNQGKPRLSGKLNGRGPKPTSAPRLAASAGFIVFLC